MTRHSPKRVFIQQIVVPAYRLPFFKRLSEYPQFSIEVHSSDKAAAQPKAGVATGFATTIHHCHSFLSGRFYWQKKMKLPAEFSQGDIVVFNSNPRILSNLFLILAAKRRKCEVISWNHYMSSTSGALSSRFRKRLTAFLCDRYLVYTKHEADQMIADGVDPDLVDYVNNTIDTDKIFHACLDFEGSDEKHNLGSPADVINQIRVDAKKLKLFSEQAGLSENTLLFCGRLVKKSRVHQLIDALVKVTDEIDDINLVVVGDGPERDSLEAYATQRGVQDRIKWLGAIYEETELAPWFLAAHLFVFPGAIGLSLNHAMAYGVTVLTHKNDKFHGPEFSYLVNGKNGFLFEENDSASIAETVIASLQSNGLHATSLNCLKLIHEELTFSNMVTRYIDCLDKNCE